MDNQVNQPSNKKNGEALGITALVLGILSICTMCFIIVSLTSAIAAVIFGILSAIFEKNKIGISGIILGVVCALLTLVLYIVLGVLDANILMIPEWYHL